MNTFIIKLFVNLKITFHLNFINELVENMKNLNNTQLFIYCKNNLLENPFSFILNIYIITRTTFVLLFLPLDVHIVNSQLWVGHIWVGLKFCFKHLC
jgi:hypothetical protein